MSIRVRMPSSIKPNTEAAITVEIDGREETLTLHSQRLLCLMGIWGTGIREIPSGGEPDFLRILNDPWPRCLIPAGKYLTLTHVLDPRTRRPLTMRMFCHTQCQTTYEFNKMAFVLPFMKQLPLSYTYVTQEFLDKVEWPEPGKHQTVGALPAIAYCILSKRFTRKECAEWIFGHLDEILSYGKGLWQEYESREWIFSHRQEIPRFLEEFRKDFEKCGFFEMHRDPKLVMRKAYLFDLALHIGIWASVADEKALLLALALSEPGRELLIELNIL
ncbi:MAG: hypothetical protein K8I29_15985 [Alphaproteobacteria bacterium]|uniref:Uncharacterized protein n=1 Tax=Candidatus Nitrobium versatile TaxID=2884831 RepID=A0A953M231_9BACT|nr:hypothetical protein [Candidatus Nitrobium versatile]